MQSTELMPVTIGIRLTARQAGKLRALAAADDRRPSAVARRIIAAALDQREIPEEVSVP